MTTGRHPPGQRARRVIARRDRTAGARRRFRPPARGVAFLTFEYFHPYAHFPEALVYQTADSLDRMLGIKA